MVSYFESTYNFAICFDIVLLIMDQLVELAFQFIFTDFISPQNLMYNILKLTFEQQ